MKLASKSEILGINDLKTEDIEVSEWNMTVRIKALSLAQFTSLTKTKLSDEQYFYNILGMSLVDEEGKRLFTNKECEQLGEKSADALKQIFSHIEILNGLKKTNEQRKEELADPLKDLPTA